MVSQDLNLLLLLSLFFMPYIVYYVKERKKSWYFQDYIILQIDMCIYHFMKAYIKKTKDLK